MDAEPKGDVASVESVMTMRPLSVDNPATVRSLLLMMLPVPVVLMSPLPVVWM